MKQRTVGQRAFMSDSRRSKRSQKRPDPFYLSKFWKDLRDAALQRDGKKCTVPGCGSIHRLTVDHIVPRKRGGPDTLANLRTLCGPCHSRTTQDGNVGPLRAIGCTTDGLPLDPTHHWADG